MARIDDLRALAALCGYEWTHNPMCDQVIMVRRPNINFVYWHPFSDANAALEVIEAMWKKGWSWDGGNFGEGIYSAAFFADSNFHRYEGGFCEVICEAALAAVRSEG